MFTCDPTKCDNLTSDVFQYVSNLDVLYVGIHTYGTLGYVLPICHGQTCYNFADKTVLNNAMCSSQGMTTMANESLDNK